MRTARIPETIIRVLQTPPHHCHAIKCNKPNFKEYCTPSFEFPLRYNKISTPPPPTPSLPPPLCLFLRLKTTCLNFISEISPNIMPELQSRLDYRHRFCSKVNEEALEVIEWAHVTVT